MSRPNEFNGDEDGEQYQDADLTDASQQSAFVVGKPVASRNES